VGYLTEAANTVGAQSASLLATAECAQMFTVA
jgi:hypothetical protein